MAEETPELAQLRVGAEPADGTEPGGRVERVEGEHDTYPNRRWVTYRTYLDGVFLGNAVTEDEGWRWIEDMRKFEAREKEQR